MEFAPCKGIREILHVESGILEIFDGGILNPGSWIPEYSCRNPESKFRQKISGIRLLESRIQDCLGFPYMGRRNVLFFVKLKGFFSVYTPLTDHGHEANSSEKLINVTNLLHNGLLHF